MTLEFFEQDEEGKYISVGIDGKRIILPTSKTIADLLNFKPNAPVYVSAAPPVPKSYDPAPQVESAENLITIERGDFVSYQPIFAAGYSPQERADHAGLTIGKQYRVLDCHEDSYDIIDDTASAPQRIGIMSFDVSLLRKTPKVRAVQKQQFEMLMNCPNCVDPKDKKPLQVVLSTDGTKEYFGECEECHCTLHAPYPTPVAV